MNGAIWHKDLTRWNRFLFLFCARHGFHWRKGMMRSSDGSGLGSHFDSSWWCMSKVSTRNSFGSFCHVLAFLPLNHRKRTFSPKMDLFQQKHAITTLFHHEFCFRNHHLMMNTPASFAFHTLLAWLWIIYHPAWLSTVYPYSWILVTIITVYSWRSVFTHIWMMVAETKFPSNCDVHTSLWN